MPCIANKNIWQMELKQAWFIPLADVRGVCR